MVMKFRSPGARPSALTKAPEVTGRPVDMNPRPGPRPGAAPAPRPATPSPTMISATPYQPSQRGSGNEQMGTPGMNQAPWHAGSPSPGASGYQNALQAQQYGMNGMQGYQNAMNAMNAANQRAGTNPPAQGPQQGRGGMPPQQGQNPLMVMPGAPTSSSAFVQQPNNYASQIQQYLSMQNQGAGMSQAPWHAGSPSPGASGYQNAMQTQQYGMNGMQGYQNAMQYMQDANQRLGTNPPNQGQPGGIDGSTRMWLDNQPAGVMQPWQGSPPARSSYPGRVPSNAWRDPDGAQGAIPGVVSENYNQNRAYAPGRPNPGTYRPASPITSIDPSQGGIDPLPTDPNQRVGTNPPNPNPWQGRMPGTAPAPTPFPGGQPGGMPPVGGGLPRTQPPRDPNLERFPTIRDVPPATAPRTPQEEEQQETQRMRMQIQRYANDPRIEIQNGMRSMQSALDAGNFQQARAMQDQMDQFSFQTARSGANPYDTLRGTGLPGDPNAAMGQMTQASGLPQNSPLMGVYQNAMAQGNMGLANAIREQMLRQAGAGFTSPGLTSYAGLRPGVQYED